MSVNPIGSALATAAQRVTSGASASSKPSAIATAVEEANETKATTIKEAQNGDQVARQKLRAIEARAQQVAPAKAKSIEPGKGTAVDHDA
jgi:uncharacterized protein involved in type VI secretion and phage assembly